MDIITIFAACFDGDTPVATETGFKRIDEIQVGDKVWSYNVETGEKSLKKVKQVFVKESNEILHLETTEGEIDATTNHPFYVTGKGWVAAGDLVVGDEIHALDGNTGTVTGLKIEELDKPISVYNLEVEDFNSYFVGDGVLVHNGCNKVDDKTAKKIAQAHGYENAEDFKKFVLKDLIEKYGNHLGKGGQYNIKLDEHTKEIILEKISNTATQLFTDLFYK
jgi:hypothetical protein